MTTPNDLPASAVAVVGMAGRFPGANTLSRFWENLRGGVESITTLDEDELLTAGIDEKALSNANYVRRAALLDGIDEFDAEFFGYTPHAARRTDPQHRLFLQSAWHALEDAGYDPLAPGGIEGSVGVYATSTTSGYLLHNLMSHVNPDAVIGQGVTFEMVNLSLQNDKDYLATKVAHQFNLRGPALSVQTACSSALVAVHLACQSILNGECDMALAGGASLRIPHHVGYWYDPGSMVSPSGHCRPFDVRADGTIFGSGVGVVVLKPLEDAVAAGDRIHAVIRGSALNNDGSTKMTYAAPNAAGQADVIAEAHAVAEVDSATISYVETHGTGTPLGDPIEIEGLRQAFAVSEMDRAAPCFIGSVKSNIGHLESASGIASLIKTILCLKHRELPATLHYTSPNPELHLDSGPFEIRAEHGPWEADGLRRAGVSSFGVGGTNAHVVLEEWPDAAQPASAPNGPHVLVLSANSAEALEDSRKALVTELSGDSGAGPNLADVAYTLGRRRKARLRMAAVVRDAADAVNVLGADEHDNAVVNEGASGDVNGKAGAAAERLAFLFPGQGAQHAGMARGLYDAEPVFAEHFDACAAGFSDELGIDLRDVVFNGNPRDLERTDRTQPALFTVEYALAKLAESYGLRPAALAGHSIGEYAAAAFAGVFDVETAVQVVAMRARLMHAAPRGVMVAVALSPEALAGHLTDDIDLAAVNDPDGCVVAGPEDAIREFTQRVKQAGVTARRVRTSHAFHSRLMDAMIPEFTAFLSRVTLNEPRIPLLSNLTGTWMTPGEAVNPTTWARSVRGTVRFADEVAVLLENSARVLVEVGPGGTLTSSAARHSKWSAGHSAVRLMRHHAQNRDDRDTFLMALGQLWAGGVDVDWTPLRGIYQPRLVSLPGYPFERAKHWLDHNPDVGWVGVSGDGAASGASTARAVRGGDATATMQATLQRLWAMCLGVASVERTANFFDIGGDSLVAISVAMAATHEGLDLTPQDLYDHPTIPGLAKALVERYQAGGLGRQSAADTDHPPLPPNLAFFLDHGVRELGRWRTPLILRLRSDVSASDAQAVLDALVDHHEALRLRITEQAGTWEQDIAEPGTPVEMGIRPLPDGTETDGPEEREAILSELAEHVGKPDLGGPPLSAVYFEGTAERAPRLAISVHAAVCDEVSRDIVLTDLFTGFAQRLPGNDIALQSIPVTWREWSQQCAALAMHPAVVESRQYWLNTAQAPTVRLAAEADANWDPPGAGDMAKITSSFSALQTSEIDDARRRLHAPIDEVLLTALAAAVGEIVGPGEVAVDVAGQGRSVLKPDVELRRTLGWIATLYPVNLACPAGDGPAAQERLDAVHATLEEVPHYGIGYGLLRYLYGPTVRTLGATRPAEIHFAYLNTVPDLVDLAGEDAPVRFDSDLALPVRETPPGLGYPLEVRAYRAGGVLHLDWWYDGRSLEAATVQSLADALTGAAVTLVREALEAVEARAVEQTEDADEQDELALVDLS